MYSSLILYGWVQCKFGGGIGDFTQLTWKFLFRLLKRMSMSTSRRSWRRSVTQSSPNCTRVVGCQVGCLMECQVASQELELLPVVDLLVLLSRRLIKPFKVCATSPMFIVVPSVAEYLGFGCFSAMEWLQDFIKGIKGSFPHYREHFFIFFFVLECCTISQLSHRCFFANAWFALK